MKHFFHFIRVTLVGGILFLVPFTVIFIILGKSLGLADKAVMPLTKTVHVERVIGTGGEKVVAVAVLVLVCFLSGCIARTRRAKRVVGRLETSVLTNVPGYDFFKGVGESLLGGEETRHWQVILVHIEESWQIAFLIEWLENGLVAVYVPDAPSPKSGAVHLLTPDRVLPVDISSPAALKCLKRLGEGTNAVFGHISVASKSA
jgi:uncharacterized membrane protein